MIYYDPNLKRWTLSGGTISETRARFANWQKFKNATGYWPHLSIMTFVMRFVLVFAIAGVAGWYGLIRHDWTRGQYFLFIFGVAAPVLFFWFILERIAWTHDLRERELISRSDVWGFDHFPADKFPEVFKPPDD